MRRRNPRRISSRGHQCQLGRRTDRSTVRASRRMQLSHQVRQWEMIWARVGSANGLKAGSQPSIAGFRTGFSAGVESCWFGLVTGATGNRSPLRIRLTETTGTALLAVTGLVSAGKNPAIKQLKKRAAAKCLKREPDVSDKPNKPDGTRSAGFVLATS